MKYYLAGPSAILEDIKGYMEALDGMDLANTLDWTQFFDPAIKHDKDSLYLTASRDRQAVEECDVLIMVLDPTVQTTGAWVEMGVALHNEKTVMCFFNNPVSFEERDEYMQKHIFLYLADIVHVCFADFCRSLLKYKTAMEDEEGAIEHYVRQRELSLLNLLFERKHLNLPDVEVSLVEAVKNPMIEIELEVDNDRERERQLSAAPEAGGASPEV